MLFELLTARAKFVRGSSLLADQTETVCICAANLGRGTSAATTATTVYVSFVVVDEIVVARSLLCYNPTLMSVQYVLQRRSAGWQKPEVQSPLTRHFLSFAQSPQTAPPQSVSVSS